jgi:HicB-like protein involved in pilus formation
MPEKLHADLAEAADRGGVSLNQLITNTLAESIGEGRIPSKAQTPREDTQPDGQRGRWFTALLIVNLLVVAAAGVLAILLLVSAWSS